MTIYQELEHVEQEVREFTKETSASVGVGDDPTLHAHTLLQAEDPD